MGFVGPPVMVALVHTTCLGLGDEISAFNATVNILNTELKVEI
jgi:hypothetical protein